MNREPITLRNLLMRTRLQDQKVCVTYNYRRGAFKVDQHVEHHIKFLVKPNIANKIEHNHGTVAKAIVNELRAINMLS